MIISPAYKRHVIGSSSSCNGNCNGSSSSVCIVKISDEVNHIDVK